MRQQAAQCQPNLNPIDTRIRAASDTAAQDMDRERDHDALMPWQLLHGSVEIARFDPHGVLGIHAVGVRRPVATARIGAPALVAAIG